MIKSKDNSLIKKVTLLMQNRKEREKSGCFVAEGLRFCREAVLSGAKIFHVLMTEEFLNSNRALAYKFSAVCSDVRLISESIANKLGATVNSQGVFCVCAMKNTSISLLKNRYIALENLRDPGNLGTIIRSAQAFGVDGVILIGNCADVYNPKVLRSTMGTIFSLDIFNFKDINEAKNAFTSSGLYILGAILDKNSKELSKIKFPKKTVCLIGNEANGLTQCAKDICNEFVFIEMSGQAESLNAAVAASVIMWEMQKN